MGKLLYISQSQKQDAAIRRIGKDAITNRIMETMEEAEDPKNKPDKIGYQKSKGI